MSAFFLGRWLGLGNALAGDGFGGYQIAYVDCPVVTVSAAGDALIELDAAGDAVVAVAAAPDAILNVQAGCDG